MLVQLCCPWNEASHCGGRFPICWKKSRKTIIDELYGRKFPEISHLCFFFFLIYVDLRGKILLFPHCTFNSFKVFLLLALHMRQLKINEVCGSVRSREQASSVAFTSTDLLRFL